MVQQQVFDQMSENLSRPVVDDWGQVKPWPLNGHDQKLLEILDRHGFGQLSIPIPLQTRYTKGRRWSGAEFENCFTAWSRGVPLTLIAACLNRNPQDIIYKLLARCEKDGIRFSQKGASVGSERWSQAVAKCASALFEAGLPAWKIAVLFRVDFEHVEKALFVKRKGYGHSKKNPFGICTDHKVLTNRAVVNAHSHLIRTALDAFAGHGTLTRILVEESNAVRIDAVEQDQDTFASATVHSWPPSVSWHNCDNIHFLKQASEAGNEYDLIDLDPFVSCHTQVAHIWPLLSEKALLFVTFGGEYRRSFIQGNRKAISARYGYSDFVSPNGEYLELVPYAFLGWIAHEASKHACVIKVLRAVRYANVCRFWTLVERSTMSDALEWRKRNTRSAHGGYIFTSCDMPRFREVRHELEMSKTELSSL